MQYVGTKGNEMVIKLTEKQTKAFRNGENIVIQTCNQNSWKLPTIEELLSIVDYTKSEPACIFKDTFSNCYWSSTTAASNSSRTWGVNFYNGYSYNDYKTSNGYVRCVREKEDGSFEWSKSSTNTMSWHEANEWAKTLTDEDVYKEKL